MGPGLIVILVLAGAEMRLAWTEHAHKHHQQKELTNPPTKVDLMADRLNDPSNTH